MSGVLASPASLGRMDPADLIHVEKLLAEIRRYLALVELLRSAGYEPHWRAEPRAGQRLGHC